MVKIGIYSSICSTEPTTLISCFTACYEDFILRWAHHFIPDRSDGDEMYYDTKLPLVIRHHWWLDVRLMFHPLRLSCSESRFSL